jgi:organic hydroperoxide reductase OsmC/OhrA
MKEHRVQLVWDRSGGPFERGNYVRDHRLKFDGGQQLGASAAADYGGNATLADPEQLLVSALSSCHLLTLLAVAANRGYVIDRYEDDAIALLGKNAEGQTAVIEAVLRPRIHFAGERVPDVEELQRLHERAHKACFIANSVRTEVKVEPRF